MKIMNIKFRKTKKVYPFLINDEKNYKKGDHVIVDTIGESRLVLFWGRQIKNLKRITKTEMKLK